MFVPHLNRVTAVFGFAYDSPVFRLLEHGSKLGSHHRIIFDQEYANHAAPFMVANTAERTTG